MTRSSVPALVPAKAGLRALREAAAGISRKDAYLTNAVKHFKWKEVRKRRIHDKPKSTEIKACKPWLEAEIHAVAPRVVVALGATAVYSLLGTKVKVTQDRGKVIDRPPGPPVVVTIHPSALLRTEDRAERDAGFEALVADLRVAAEAARRGA